MQGITRDSGEFLGLCMRYDRLWEISRFSRGILRHQEIQKGLWDSFYSFSAEYAAAFREQTSWWNLFWISESRRIPADSVIKCIGRINSEVPIQFRLSLSREGLLTKSHIARAMNSLFSRNEIVRLCSTIESCSLHQHDNVHVPFDVCGLLLCEICTIFPIAVVRLLATAASPN